MLSAKIYRPSLPPRHELHRLCNDALSGFFSRRLWHVTCTDICVIKIQQFAHQRGASTMLWRGSRESSNIEDRRGMHPGIAVGGLGGLVLLLISLYFGFDPSSVVNPDGAVDASGPANTSAADQETKEFVSTVVGYTEDTWSDIFRQSGQTYREPKVVLFTGAVNSACGFAQAAMGPFYCPPDEKVYLDTSFF